VETYGTIQGDHGAVQALHMQFEPGILYLLIAAISQL
jgi:hypothetical protein